MNSREIPADNKSNVCNPSALDTADILNEIFVFFTHSWEGIRDLHKFRTINKKWKSVVDNKCFKFHWENLKKENPHLQEAILEIDRLNISYFHKFYVAYKKMNLSSKIRTLRLKPQPLTNKTQSLTRKRYPETSTFQRFPDYLTWHITPVKEPEVQPRIFGSYWSQKEEDDWINAMRCRTNQTVLAPDHPLLTPQEKIVLFNVNDLHRSYANGDPLVPYTQQLCTATGGKMLGSYFPEPYTFRVDDFAIRVFHFPQKNNTWIDIQPLSKVLHGRVEVLNG